MPTPPAAAPTPGPRRSDTWLLRLSKIGTQHLAQDQSLRLRIILCNQQALSILLLFGVFSGLYWLMGEPRFLYVSVPAAVLALAVLAFNGLRLHTWARFLLVVSGTGEVVIVSQTMGTDTWLWMYFFVTVLMPVIVWERDEVWQFVLSLLVVLVAYVGILYHWLPWAAQAVPPPPEVLRVGQPLAALSSLLAVALIFRTNNTLLASLLRRSLRTEQERAAALEAQGQELQHRSAAIAQTNAELQQAEGALRANQDRLAAQAAELQANETRLNETIARLTDNQRALEHSRYVDNGMVRLSDAMRFHTGMTMAGWCDRTMRFLCEYTGGVQGVLYVCATDANGNFEPAAGYRRTGGYAVSTDAPETIQAAVKQGLAATALRTRKPMHVQQLTDRDAADHRINLGAGQLTAKEVVLVPLLEEQRVIGVFEVLALRPLPLEAVEFLFRSATPVAGTLVSIHAQVRVQELLVQSESQAAKLQVREQQLHEQLERMVSTQAAMRQAERELKTSQDKLRHLNENLEQMVEARTRELQSAMDNLQQTQTQLVQSEKMATLGQLIAGIAHEINTPIGAVKASSENLADLLSPFIRDLPLLLNRLSPEEEALFLELAVHVTRKHERHYGSTEERKLRRALQRNLEAEGIADADEAARRIIESGFYDDPSPYYPLLRHVERELVLDTMYRLGQLRVNIENIGMAVDKTKKIVFALKNYAHSHNEDDFIPVNLQENIDTIITLFTNKIKYTVQLDLDYQPVPDIQGSPDELGQIWTNMVHNALQAMNYEGRLGVRLFPEGEYAVVQITDSGSGIPPEALPKIFDAFFTTKKRGEGTGLGLSLVKKIIDRHGGHVHVESEPGRTCFTVRLPFHATPQPVRAAAQAVGDPV